MSHLQRIIRQVRYDFVYIVLFYSILSAGRLFAQENVRPDFSQEHRGNDPTSYTSESVLSEGKWVKIAVVRTGVYKITYDDLKAMGFNPSDIDPRNLALYGNGGEMLPEQNSHFRIDDLFENPIFIKGEEDGKFDVEDVLYFYGTDAINWKLQNGRFVHKINYYADTNYYFFTHQNHSGKRLVTATQPPGEPQRVTTHYLHKEHHEADLESLIMSGKEWFGEEFNTTHPSRNFSFQLTDRDVSLPVRFEIGIAGRSITETFNFSVSANGQTIISPIAFQQLSIGNSTHAREVNQNIQFTSSVENLSFDVSIDAQNDNSKAWLNYIRINSWRKLNYRNEQLRFSNPEMVVEGGYALYEIETSNPTFFLWDITNPLSPMNQAFTQVNAERITFKASADTLREYIAFDPQNAFKTEFFQSVANQNLHAIQACDMLIVTHPNFLDQAHDLASVHYADDGLHSIVVNLYEIYNEFSGGKPDITAIRDFARMVYIRSNQQLKYLLLFGDGSYDYKNRIPNNTNFIPTYQGSGSLVETQSFVSDDYFGLFDINEGAEMFGVLDIGIGRFPVSRTEDADAMVEKVRNYLMSNREQSGEWRNNITFVADDADSNLHLNQAETLSDEVDTAYANLNIRKIYLDSYKRIVVPGGYRYPGANEAFLNQISEGSLIINYTGHGGITGLSDEKVFTIGEIENLTNQHKLPFFITATCEFSRFDNPGFVSAGERLLLNPTGGAVALMTTTRLAFAHSNFAVNRRVYDAMFENNKQQIRRLGDIIKLSKNPTSTYIYNFVLLGDPALRLAYPEFHVRVTEFNDQSLPITNDTLGAMSSVTVKGIIADVDGNRISDFNGILYPKMFDKKTAFKTLANDAASISSIFSYFEKLIYRGNISVQSGEFELNFMIPKDIAYQFGKTKLSFYAVDTVNFRDAGGFFDEITLGGFDESVQVDSQGPEIEMYINEPGFTDGDFSSPNPEIYIQLKDPQGIHFLGNSIGRDITLTYEGDIHEQYQLNDYFVPTLDSFGSGTIRFSLANLPNGSHKLTLKAWDLHNNSSEKERWFKVDKNASLSITELYNHPNPFADYTDIHFQHNKPNETLNIRIEFFNQMGLKVSEFQTETRSNGMQSQPIRWKGIRADGSKLPAGLYIYSAHITDQSGKTFTTSQKLLLFP